MRIVIIFLLILLIACTGLFAFNRCLFVWDGYNIISNDSEITNLLGFCFAPHQNQNKVVNVLFLSVTNTNTGGNLLLDNPDRLRSFIKDSHSKGFLVQCLIGEPRYATTSEKSVGWSKIDQILNFNIAGNPEERFDGILDTTDPTKCTFANNADGYDWEGFMDDWQIWPEYKNYMSGYTQRVSLYNASYKPIYANILLRSDYDTDWSIDSNYQDVINRMPYITLRAYKSNAAGVSSTTSAEMNYAESQGRNTLIAVNVMNTGSSTNTFFQHNNDYMEIELSSVSNNYSSKTNFIGFAINAFSAYAPESPYTEDLKSTSGGSYYTNRAPVPVFAYPNGGEVLSGTNNILWSALDHDGFWGGVSLDIYGSYDNGATWFLIVSNKGNTGTYPWDSTKTFNSTNFILKMIAYHTTPLYLKGWDYTDQNFSIQNPSGLLGIYKNADVPAVNVYPGDTNITIMAVRINSGPNDSTLTGFSLTNLGNAVAVVNITNIKIWLDNGSAPNQWDIDDIFVAEIRWDVGSSLWTNRNISFPSNLRAPGRNFVLTADINKTGPSDLIFQPVLLRNSVSASGGERGYYAPVTNNNSLTLKVLKLIINTNKTIPASYVMPGETNITVMAFNINSGTKSIFLKGLSIDNVLDASGITDISGLKLWLDKGSVTHEWDILDEYICHLKWDNSALKEFCINS